MKHLIFTISLLFTFSSFSQEIGIGLSANFPSYGISGKVKFDDNHAGQVIYGAFGTLSNISGKYSYYFDGRGEIDTYLYGQAGSWKYKAFNIDESVFGYGIGAGIEFGFSSYWWPENIKSSFEIGYGSVDLNYYDFNATTVGVAIHYYFD